MDDQQQTATEPTDQQANLTPAPTVAPPAKNPLIRIIRLIFIEGWKGYLVLFVAIPIILILVAAAIFASSGSGEYDPKPDTTALHYTHAKSISEQAYEDAKDAKYTGGAPEKEITYSAWLKLPPDSQKTLDIYGPETGYVQQGKKSGHCVVSSNGKALCYYQKADSEIAIDKILAVNEKMGLTNAVLENTYNIKLDTTSAPSAYDTVTKESYVTNLGSGYGAPSTGNYAVLRYNASFSSVDDISAAKNPAAGAPVKPPSQALSYNPNSCAPVGCKDGVYRSVQVVNREFYMLVSTDTGSKATDERNKGLYHWDTQQRSWVHVTPAIDSTGTQDTYDRNISYKIASDGCSVYYKISNKPYSIDDCSE